MNELVRGHLDDNGNIKWHTVCCGAEIKKAANRFEVIIDDSNYNYQVYDTVTTKIVVNHNKESYETKAEAEAVAEHLNNL